MTPDGAKQGAQQKLWDAGSQQYKLNSADNSNQIEAKISQKTLNKNMLKTPLTG